MNINQEQKEDKQIYIIGTTMVILIITIWVLTFFFLKDDEKRGTLGDMYGTINALFSGLAFAGIIITILLQKKELKLQREELKSTRKEFVIQNKTLKAQRFENTFFSLINLHNQIVNDIDYKVIYDEYNEKEDEILKGRDVFHEAYKQLRIELKQIKRPIANSYIKMYGKFNTDFGHYFRNLYRTFKIIDDTEFISIQEIEDSMSDKQKEYDKLNFEQRYRYTSILRAQLSDYELFILFYNNQSWLGVKFKPLVEKYSLLKTIPKHLIEYSEHWELFEPSAFDSNWE